jgi:hypothetical protein
MFLAQVVLFDNAQQPTQNFKSSKHQETGAILLLLHTIRGLPKQQTAENQQREKRANKNGLNSQNLANYFFLFLVPKVRHFQISSATRVYFRACPARRPRNNIQYISFFAFTSVESP